MTYPKYYNGIAFHVKVISETTSVWVSDKKTEVEDVNMEPFIAERKYPESTETEFKAAFNKTNKYLKSLI